MTKRKLLSGKSWRGAPLGAFLVFPRRHHCSIFTTHWAMTLFSNVCYTSTLYGRAGTPFSTGNIPRQVSGLSCRLSQTEAGSLTRFTASIIKHLMLHRKGDRTRRFSVGVFGVALHLWRGIGFHLSMRRSPLPLVAFVSLFRLLALHGYTRICNACHFSSWLLLPPRPTRTGPHAL